MALTTMLNERLKTSSVNLTWYRAGDSQGGFGIFGFAAEKRAATRYRPRHRRGDLADWPPRNPVAPSELHKGNRSIPAFRLSQWDQDVAFAAWPR